MTKKKSIDLEKKAQKILGMAEEQGAEKNFLFITTFQRYWMQINILSELEGVIAESDMLVTKEYVKGRSNIYTHPAINEYNKTAASANNTATVLIKILAGMRKDESDTDDALENFINGREEI